MANDGDLILLTNETKSDPLYLTSHKIVKSAMTSGKKKVPYLTRLLRLEKRQCLEETYLEGGLFYYFSGSGC